MTLQLPPERTLDDPHAVVDRILSETPTAAPGAGRRRRGWVAGLAVAAAAALIATAIGIGAPHRDRPQVAAPRPAPTLSATPPPATDPPDMHVNLLGETATFPTLTVQVVEVGRDPAWYGIKVRTCVRALPPGSAAKTVRLDWKPWTLSTSKGTVDTSIRQEGLGPWRDTYPYDGKYTPGDCVSGWIPIGLPKNVAVTGISFHDSLGHTANWLTETQPFPVGTALDLANARATVVSADHVSVNGKPIDLYLINVSTCAFSDGVRFRPGSWTLTTNAGTVQVRDPIADRIPLPRTYPDGSYRKGQCASGVIPFGVPHDDNVKTVNYHDPLGGRATWLAGG